MSGNDRILVDTNIFIFMLKSNRDAINMLEGKNLYFSFVSELELLGVPGISEMQETLIKQALSEINKVGYTDFIGNTVIDIKRVKKIKLPDAIIAATAIELNIPLLTADSGFSNIPGLNVILFKI